MITRSQMRRQLRAQGGIMNVTPRKKFGVGSYFQDIKDKVFDRTRKIIPNELANVAVKAAPFVAPFFPGYAAVARGLGRFDQRGSVSDAIKQGLGTFAFGKAAGKLGGAESDGGFFGGQTYSKKGFKEGPVGRLFQGGEDKIINNNKTPSNITDKKGIFERTTDKIFKDVPFSDKLDQIVKEKLLVGGVTGVATYLYQKFVEEEPPQDEGETYEQYMARRKENVGKKMRTYMDNYFANDPEYMQLDDAGRDEFVARYNVRDGGRIGLMGGSMPMGEPRVNQGGITELDFRAKGGFVPVGIKEKADDVPAMLSKNEFVFTADAVKGAGNGSVEKGAQKMYDTMKNLERRVT